MFKPLFPIGTVVTLKKDKNEEKYKFMIIGRDIETLEGEKYNYSCVVHPIGLSENVKLAVIKQEEIKEVIFLGLIDDNEEQMNALIQFNKYIKDSGKDN
ncbi:MAG: DUF4176 domain-containing protein [Mycoplasmatales bacterium]